MVKCCGEDNRLFVIIGGGAAGATAAEVQVQKTILNLSKDFESRRLDWQDFAFVS